MPPIGLAALKETAPGEQRVALVPEVASRLIKDGFAPVVEKSAGALAFLPDAAYEKAGVELLDRTAALSKAEVLLAVAPPDTELLSKLRKGQVVIGLLNSRTDAEGVAALAATGATGLDVAMLPRTLSRAQTMDVLSSQASVAGYRAAIVAAETFGRYFPMMITAAGTAKPAKVIVLGAGVAGLQAIGTAKRLGAMVTGYDVRPAARGEVESLGASFLVLKSVGDAAGEGGYARELTPEEQAAQQAELAEAIAGFDIVITTAQVPGRKPPVLVTAATVASMNAGSVIVDLGASDLGGNVEGSTPNEHVVSDNGVTIIGAGMLASQMPTAASTMFSRNVAALAATLVDKESGALNVNLEDEILDAVVVCHDGQVRKGA
jgi:NAD(P) transhydrogenase subunit alpha